ncbi:MAG: transglycosylase SLT domain-containing protein [Candidatus Kerfeldbacteria bacterium]|nr:transglycosylase SLT domain-containing protein [Candidatus Kerfeldbacteria bacterium]
MAKKILYLSVVLTAFLVFVDHTRAQTLEQSTCASRGLSVGWRPPQLAPNTCYGSLQAVSTGTGGITCLREDSCCADTEGNPTCIQRSVTQGFTPAQPDATSVKCPDGYGLVVVETTARCEKVGQLTFTPNVSLPGFPSTAIVDSHLLAKYLGAFYIYFIGVIGILAVVMMMWGGYHYIVSAGNPQKISQGKEIISNAVIGLVLALTSFVLLRTINPQLVSFAGVVPSYIQEILQSYEKTAEPLKPVECTRDILSELPATAGRIKSGGFDQKLAVEAQKYNLDVYQLLATVAVESSGFANAQSTFTRNGQTKHACGLMQVRPESTNNQYSCQDLMNPDVGIPVGVKLYNDFKTRLCQQPETAAKYCPSGTPCRAGNETFIHAAYNGGDKANWCSRSCEGQTLWQCALVEGYGETRCYVDFTDKAYQWFKTNPQFQGL